MGGYALPVRSVTKICRVRRVSIAVTLLSKKSFGLALRAAPRRACVPRLAAPQRSRVHAHGRHRCGERRKRYGRGAEEAEQVRQRSKQAKRHARDDVSS